MVIPPGVEDSRPGDEVPSLDLGTDDIVAVAVAAAAVDIVAVVAAPAVAIVAVAVE